VTRDNVADPGNLSLKIDVNGVVKQDAHTSDLILSVAQLIEWGSSFYTLHPGDVLLTGTPQGVGPVRPGDVMVASVQGIGSMRVEVK
jgi:2-keto-4-pentenoate hydratase/2-oxohepta-3-ene-1,7-dioic acid hydratase in catechol pathway